MSDHFISVILPVYKQADHIEEVVETYVNILAEIPYSHEIILVVNDGETLTWEICRSLSEQYNTVRTVRSEQSGWGRAVRLGLQESRGDILCYTNSARTNSSDLMILILYAVANSGAVIKANRHRRGNLVRKMGSLLFNIECRALFRLPTWDINATPKVFSRESYNLIQPCSDGDLLDLEIYFKCKELNKTILEVPLYSQPRRTGKSTTNYHSAMNLYWGAFQMWWKMRQKNRYVR